MALYRRGRLTETDLDGQMDEIAKEEAALEAQAAELRGKISGADSIGANISSAQALLANLRKRFDEPISWERKRRLIEVLVPGIRVDTVETCGVKQSEITVTYRFSQPDAMPLVLPQSTSRDQNRSATELSRPETALKIAQIPYKLQFTRSIEGIR